jgi:hypothetical protein
MAIEHVQSVAGSTTATTSDAIVIPTVEPDDLLLLFCTNKGATTVPSVTDDDTDGNAWARADGSGTNGATVWFKRATVDTSGKTVTASGFTTACACGLSVYRGLDSPDLPIENLTVVSQGSGVETLAGFTPTREGSLVSLAVFNRNVATSVGSPTTTNPGALDERFDVINSTVGQTCCVEHASKVQTVLGPTGNFTWTQTNSGHITIVFDLMPPPVEVSSGGNGLADGYEAKVRAKWDAIERLESERKERESAEREQKRAIEARRQALAELESQKSRRRTKAAQRARDTEREAVRAEIVTAELRAATLRAEIDRVSGEIKRIEAEITAQMEFTKRRNAALALLLVAA